MKKIALLLSVISMLSCSLDDSVDRTTPTPTAKWSLVRITGGVAGVETDLEVGQITWFFDIANNTLTVEENEEGLSHGLSEGIYAFEVLNISNADFLFIDEIEFGSINVSQNVFTIDQNIISTGTGTDGFEYRFVR